MHSELLPGMWSVTVRFDPYAKDVRVVVPNGMTEGHASILPDSQKELVALPEMYEVMVIADAQCRDPMDPLVDWIVDADGRPPSVRNVVMP